MSSRTTAAVLLLLGSLGATVACSRDDGTASAATPVRDPHRVVAEGGTLVDVRTPEEFAARHIDGARNIPVDEIAQRTGEIPRDKPVVVYCLSGGRSAHAAKVLRGAGYDVIDVGPMKAW
jgi:phage shock protein E